jgi:hypothetical protein
MQVWGKCMQVYVSAAGNQVKVPAFFVVFGRPGPHPIKETAGDSAGTERDTANRASFLAGLRNAAGLHHAA